MGTTTDFCQYKQALDDDIIDRIMDDPLAVSIIQSLNWTSLSKDELDELVPGNGPSLDMLLGSHVVVREEGLYSLDVSIQAFGFRPDNTDDMRAALSQPIRDPVCELGYLSAYIADSLVSLLFGNEPCWEGELEHLALRAGLIDADGGLTAEGRERAYAIYSAVADVFDVRPVDPRLLHSKWSSQGIGDSEGI